MNYYILISLFCIFVILGTMPIRLNYIKKKSGDLLVPLTRLKKHFAIGIFLLVFIMEWALTMREFSLFISVVLYAIPVLATELAIREILYQKTAGFYEKMLIVDGRFIARSDILALPTLEYEVEETNILKIVTKKSGVIFVRFFSVQERMQTVAIMQTQGH